jgi:hypothetical protein
VVNADLEYGCGVFSAKPGRPRDIQTVKTQHSHPANGSNSKRAKLTLDIQLDEVDRE